jgi:hypothetical protein
MANFISFVGDYLYAVFFNWYGIVLLITGAVDLIERTVEKKWQIPPSLRVAILVSVFLIAQMFAYKDLKEKYDLKLTEKPQVIYQDTAKTVADLESKKQDIKDLKQELSQLRDNKEYQRVTFRPSIMLTYNYDEQRSGWYLYSTGPGIADVRWLAVFVDNQPQPSWRNVASAFGVEGGGYRFSNVGSRIGATATIELFTMITGAFSHALDKNHNRLRIDICYCALYGGQCWLTSNLKKQGTKNTSCKEVPAVTVWRNAD